MRNASVLLNGLCSPQKMKLIGLQATFIDLFLFLAIICCGNHGINGQGMYATLLYSVFY